MQIEHVPFETTKWSEVEPAVHEGEEGFAFWRTRQFGNVRVGVVDYSPG